MSWYYVQKGMVTDRTNGPFDEDAMWRLFQSGKISRSTLVSHPVQTGGGWIALSRSSLYSEFEQRIVQRRRRRAEARRPQSGEATRSRAHRDGAAGNHAVHSEARADGPGADPPVPHARTDAGARPARPDSGNTAAARRPLAAPRPDPGNTAAARWPNIFRCARCLHFKAIVLALLSFAPAFWFAYSALSDGLAVAFDSIWGFLFCCGMILLAVLLLAVSAFWSYLLYIWIVCIAELLRCIASIEHNTRTARTHSEVEGGFREQPVPHAVAEPLKSAGGA